MMQRSTDEQTAGAVLSVRGLRKRFERRDGTQVSAIDGVSFDVHAGEVTVLLGPSGCGKTTLLRCIGGLEEPDEGLIEVQGRTVFSSDAGVSVRAERRRLSMVFQSYALWPHMTVAENIAYPLRSLPRSVRPSRPEITAKVDQIMEKVGIAGLQRQYPNAISGGQQQRVALSRALIANSQLVLFDEPLSNVDAQVREQLRVELLAMQQELQFAAVFVTHDRQEAMVLANQVAVLKGGSLLQLDEPAAVYKQPADRFVARFVGTANELPLVTVPTAGEREPDVAQTGLGDVAGRVGPGVSDMTVNAAVWRPEHTRISAHEPRAANRWRVTVEQSLYYGSQLEYVLRVGDRTMRVLTEGDAAFVPGDPAWISVAAEDVWFLREP